MERRITEEQTTKAFIEWLELNDWKIICFDFPQSGTLLMDFSYSHIFYGIGLAHSCNTEQRANEQIDKIDFVVFCHIDKPIQVFYDPNGIFN
ncbi:MAG: hypothetical protein LBH25_00950 [Fibromonadaceae bacterium]|jgi:hypothetical protein|nr:hypothetical protein [Fibromonadaceae bacterium]